MSKLNRHITITVLCMVIFILPACRAKNISVSGGNESSNLYPASAYENNQKKWGYINHRGDFIIKPSFDSAEEFQSNGLAVVRNGNDYGIIDIKGNYITEHKFSYISPFSEGIAIVEDASGFKAIDEKGKIIFEGSSYIGYFKNGMAYFNQKSTDGRYFYGYFNNLGEIVIQPKYEFAENFIDDKAVVKLGDYNYQIIDKKGNPLSTFNYFYLGDMGDGLVAFREKEGDMIGYMDEKGKIVIPPSFISAEAFKDGFAVTRGENFIPSYGLINKKGEYVIKPEYNAIRNLGEGMFAVGTPINNDFMDMGSRFAIVNSSGEFLTDFVYYNVGNFKDGLAFANDKAYTFLINKEGKRADKIGSLEGIGELTVLGDVIKANIDNRLSYIGEQGNFIWKEDGEYKITREISIREVKFRPNRDLLIYYPEVSGFSDKTMQDTLNKSLEKKFLHSGYAGIKPEDDLQSHYESDFTISFYNKDLLILEMTGYDYPFGAAHGMPVRGHSHIDLKNGKTYELRDLFKENSSYIEKLNGIVGNKINERPDEFFPDAFQGISEKQGFILTQDSLVIYFAPYEIASYAAGFPEFKIPYGEIMGIIDTEGELWKAFN